MRAVAWILGCVIAAVCGGGAALLVYSVASERPRDLRIEEPTFQGPSDEQVRHMDPNAGLIGTPLAPLLPSELLPLDDIAAEATQAQPAAPAENWLISGAFGEGPAAEQLARALLAKGAPNDVIAIVRRTSAQGRVDWRVEVGPLTADQAVELQSMLQAQGLEFNLE